MIHKCICSQYSLKVPHPKEEPKENQDREATAKQAAHSTEPRPALGREVLTTGRPAPHGQTPGGGVQSRFSHQLSGVRK